MFSAAEKMNNMKIVLILRFNINGGKIDGDTFRNSTR